MFYSDQRTEIETKTVVKRINLQPLSNNNSVLNNLKIEIVG